VRPADQDLDVSKLAISQLRSGEGWILTDISSLGPEALATDLADLLNGPVLIASDDFESHPPAGGQLIDAGLYAFPPEAAKALLREPQRWTKQRAIFAVVPSLPDADARRRWISDALRPWDPDRLRASVYGQLGKRFANRGLWFKDERDRARYVAAAVTKVLGERGVRLPNGDVTLVLETPTDSTFEAEFTVQGSGDALSLKRDFATRGVTRQWFVRRGEWEATERRRSTSGPRSFRQSAAQVVASGLIFLLAIPTFLFVAMVAIITKLTGSTTTVSATSKRVDDKTTRAA
jgi:hypothetical protein